MAVAHIASTAGYFVAGGGHGDMAATTTAATSFTFAYTAKGTGNAVLFWVESNPSSTSPTTCTLSATGWTFTQIGGIVNGGTSAGCGAMFRAYAPNTSAATMTVTWNQSWGNFSNNLIGEFSGADATNFVSASNGATGTGTPTVSVTPADADCMIWVPCNDSITAVGSIGGSTATKGADDTQQDWSEYRLLSGGSGVAQSCTFTGSGAYIIGAVAIKPAVVGAANWKKETYWWQRATDSSGIF